MNISIVIPLFNEAESLQELHDRIIKVMENNHFSYEILWIDDGSNDNSWKILEELHLKNLHSKAIHFANNYGKSQALHAGFEKARGNIIFTMDADLQDNPQEIPDMYQMITQQGFDLVSGWKKKRYDNKWLKNIPSKLFNWAARKTSGIQLNDFNCGLKAYKKQVIKNIQVQGDMHRYIPILAKNAGFKNITEKVVEHQKRKYGVTKFGAERFINGFLDLITIWFVSKFGRQPMHFFGFMGILMFGTGFLTTFGMGVHKLLCIFYWQKPAILIADNPLFYIALTTIILGTQLFLAGLIGELILRSKTDKKNYHISKSLL